MLFKKVRNISDKYLRGSQKTLTLQEIIIRGISSAG